MTKSFKPKRDGPGRTFNGRKEIDALYLNTDDWRNYRARFLNENKLCYACGKQATVVDHITPHKGDKTLFEKLDNHLPLCFICHNFVTAKFDRNYVKGASIEPKLRWIANKRLHLNLGTRVKVLGRYKAQV